MQNTAMIFFLNCKSILMHDSDMKRDEREEVDGKTTGIPEIHIQAAYR